MAPQDGSGGGDDRRSILLDDDGAFHVRMHRADVLVGAGLVKDEGELVALLDRRRAKAPRLIDTDDVVRRLVIACQVTVVPGATVSVAGTKAKFWILISADPAAAAGGPPDPAANASKTPPAAPSSARRILYPII
jgi:hypothetical protein